MSQKVCKVARDEIDRLTKQLNAIATLQQACGGVSAGVSSDFVNVPRGTSMEKTLDVPRGTLRTATEIVNVPRGTSMISTPPPLGKESLCPLHHSK